MVFMKKIINLLLILLLIIVLVLVLSLSCFQCDQKTDKNIIKNSSTLVLNTINEASFDFIFNNNPIEKAFMEIKFTGSTEQEIYHVKKLSIHWKNELNNAYNDLLKFLDEDDKIHLEKSQKAWNEYIKWLENNKWTDEDRQRYKEREEYARELEEKLINEKEEANAK